MEPYTPVNGSAGNSAPVGGKKHRKSMKLVTKKRARTILKKLGMKLRGGAEDSKVAVPKADAAAADDVPATGAMGTGATGGKRHRGTKKTHRRGKKSLFGLKY